MNRYAISCLCIIYIAKIVTSVDTLNKLNQISNSPKICNVADQQQGWQFNYFKSKNNFNGIANRINGYDINFVPLKDVYVEEESEDKKFPDEITKKFFNVQEMSEFAPANPNEENTETLLENDSVSRNQVRNAVQKGLPQTGDIYTMQTSHLSFTPEGVQNIEEKYIGTGKGQVHEIIIDSVNPASKNNYINQNLARKNQITNEKLQKMVEDDINSLIKNRSSQKDQPSERDVRVLPQGDLGSRSRSNDIKRDLSGR